MKTNKMDPEAEKLTVRYLSLGSGCVSFRPPEGKIITFITTMEKMESILEECNALRAFQTEVQ